MTLANLVKARREELGMSLKAVGDLAGLSPSAVLNIESGQQRDFYVSSLVGLSRALRLRKTKVLIAAAEAVDVPAEVVAYMKGDVSG